MLSRAHFGQKQMNFLICCFGDWDEFSQAFRIFTMSKLVIWEGDLSQMIDGMAITQGEQLKWHAVTSCLDAIKKRWLPPAGFKKAMKNTVPLKKFGHMGMCVGHFNESKNKLLQEIDNSSPNWWAQLKAQWSQLDNVLHHLSWLSVTQILKQWVNMWANCRNVALDSKQQFLFKNFTITAIMGQLWKESHDHSSSSQDNHAHILQPNWRITKTDNAAHWKEWLW